MPGTELFGEEEKKEVIDVLNTGVLFRYNHDAQRKGQWKAKEFEAEIAKFTGAKHALAVSSGNRATGIERSAMAALNRCAKWRAIRSMVACSKRSRLYSQWSDNSSALSFAVKVRSNLAV